MKLYRSVYMIVFIIIFSQNKMNFARKYKVSTMNNLTNPVFEK